MGMKRTEAGFSILELAIVLTVIALIVSSSLAVAATRIAAAKVENTLNKSDVLMEVIAAYVRTFRHLPCPANPRAKTTDADFGVASMNDNGTPETVDDVCNATNILSSGSVFIGSVPTATLGLPYSAGIDGWNRRLTYVVDQNLTNATNYAGDPNAVPVIPPAVTAGSIIVRSSMGGSEITNQAVLVIISHGSNGHGAWSGKGGTARERVEADPPLNSDELANINPDPAHAQAGLGSLTDDVIFVQKPGDTTFDDMVQYKLKWHLPYQ